MSSIKSSSSVSNITPLSTSSKKTQLKDDNPHLIFTKIKKNYNKWLKEKNAENFSLATSSLKAYIVSNKVIELLLNIEDFKNFNYFFIITLLFENSDFIKTLNTYIRNFFIFYLNDLNDIENKLKSQKDMIYNFFQEILDDFELEICLKKENNKQISPNLYKYIIDLNYHQNIKLFLFDLFDKSYIFSYNKEIMCKKRFFFFFNDKTYNNEKHIENLYKENIVLKKNKIKDISQDELNDLLIDEKYLFLYNSKNYKEKICKEIESSSLKKALYILKEEKIEVNEMFKKSEETSQYFFQIENIKDWDLINGFDKRFIIYDNKITTNDYYESFYKKINKKKFLYYFFIFIYCIILKNNNNKKNWFSFSYIYKKYILK